MTAQAMTAQAMTLMADRRGSRRPARLGPVALLLALALGMPPGEGAAQVPGRCVPGSIGPGGCASIRPQDQPPDLPEFALPSQLDRLLGPGPAALADPSDLRRRSGGIERLDPWAPGTEPGDPLPALRPLGEPAPGRDPRALRSYQTPYVLD